MPDCCTLENPCSDHLVKAFGDLIPNFDKSKLTVADKNNVPFWLSHQFLLWNRGDIPEEDFLKSFHYLGRNGLVLYNGKPIPYPQPKAEKQAEPIE